MDITSIKSNSSTSVTSNALSLSAKLKRLQIEESLLIQSLSKCVPEGSQLETQIDATSYLIFSEFNAFSTKTKNTYRDIKLKFQDINTCTSSKEMLKALDIDEVKSNILELENSIKTFKSYLQSELAGYKTDEQKLNQILNENPVLNSKNPRISTAKYNEIVPSPVKTMMNSPFKCSEVQQFQEFMMNSANRYGGWNEYHHNIFVNQWQKHFNSQLNNSFDGSGNAVENSPALHSFLYELHPKLQDITEEEIISHAKWYSKYMYLKERQQKAIDKWRSNKKIMKLVKVEPEVKKDSLRIRKKINRRKSVYDHNDRNTSDELTNIIQESKSQSPKQDVSRFFRKCLSEDIQQQKIGENKTFNNDYEFQNPTMQWNNKVKSKTINIETNLNNLENIKRLGIPKWRLGL